MNPIKVAVHKDVRKIERFKRRAAKEDGEQKVPLDKLMPDSFVAQYSDFQTLQAMIDASGIKDPEELGGEQLAEFFSAHTRFKNWQEMVTEAYRVDLKRKLSL